jgi:exonuclease SbcC
MTARFGSISITNVRSITGTITVPLGAPVVLIQGPNGAGKTSILSAIELALTGEVLDMRRTDPNYSMHLLHRGATEGRIILNADGLGPTASLAEMKITATGPQGRPLLDQTDGRFFSERCYLAQSTLGRLLEIYHTRTRGRTRRSPGS